MKPPQDICSLDYLIGTLATAYKGVITSLVVKDFCMTGEGGQAAITGTVVSLPAGDYEARLIRSGAELSRAAVRNGHFELKAAHERVQNARNLQIDIIQTGRHIGTFLLKRERGDGIYLSAVELSDELKGMDFKPLTVPLREKVGLLQKAEEIISQTASTKKDWTAFSEKLGGFSSDVFWSAPDAFYGAFSLLARFSRLAAERADSARTHKPASNFLDLIELLLEHETDTGRLRGAVDAWLSEAGGSRADFTPHLRRTAAVLASLTVKFPDAEIGPALRTLLGSVREKAEGAPLLGRPVPDSLREFIRRDEYDLLNNYTDLGRRELLRRLSDADRSIAGKDHRNALAALAGLDVDALSDEKMAAALFDVINGSLRRDCAGPFATALIEAFPLFSKLSGRALGSVTQNLPLIMKKLIGFGMPDACRAVLNEVQRAGPSLTEEILMHPGIALSVLESGDDELTRDYRSLLTRIVIPSAKVRGLSADTWAELVNPLHLERLSKFLDILQLGGGRLRDVLAHVAANLYVSGVLIPDDKLFQRRVSAYLNSGAVQENLLPNYLVLKKLPVYFNEVGAVSMIRDYSTEIDSWGNDPALYFLRKQVHVNASNYNIRLIEEILRSWVSSDPSLLKNVVPPDVFDALKPALIGQYSAVVKPFFESLDVLDGAGLHLERLRDITDAAMEKTPQTGTDEARAKILLLCKLYRELVKKYSFPGGGFDRADPGAALSAAVERVKTLNRTVLSPEKTAARESLYFKRHIAFGIPSVLGSYHEPKFDALGEMLREEGKIGVMLEETIAGIGSEDATAATGDIARGLAALKAAYELLVLRGLRNFQIDELIAIFENNALSLSQVADLLTMWRKELAWMVEAVNRAFLKPVTNVLALYSRDELPDALMNLDPEEKDFEHKVADIMIRDMISDVPGLIESDRLIGQIMTVIADRPGHGIDEKLNAGAASGDRTFFPLHELPDPEAMRLAPLLGGKAKNLAYLLNRGFSTPPGVVFSSLHTDQYREYTEGPEFLPLLKQAVRNIEEKTGTVYGGKKPLFLSVRSGSYLSMPGILSSILYCGMNSRTIDAFIRETGDPRLAWDAYRRFIEHYGTVVLGLEPGVFENIMDDFMKKRETPERESLGPERLQDIAVLYKEELSQRGREIPEDVYEQLRMSVRAVYASWSGGRAEQFRKAASASERWGTAVTLMQMVPGNAAGSGASVFFTRNPFTAEPGIYGETRENATGDDLVRGKQRNRPLAKDQARDGRESLEELDPELFMLHSELAKKIEDAMGGLPQEAEVTYTKGPGGKRSLFVLQTRRMEFGGDPGKTFDEICRMESRIIGRGVGAHGGALSGAASFASSPEQAMRLREKAGLPVILLRKTADTDDVSLMPAVGGIITAAGGVTSHAAVLAQKFDVTAVVACSALSIETDERGEPYARIGDAVIKEGALISMDGARGLVFSGGCLSTTGADDGQDAESRDLQSPGSCRGFAP